MSFVRSTTLRASSIARYARPARSFRTAELQPWQRMIQRRTYASGHGHGETKKSDLPWAATAVVGTGVGLYLVMTQDLGHHEEHGEHHDPSHEEHLDKKSAEIEGPEPKKKTGPRLEEMKQENKEGKGDTVDDPSSEQSDKPDPRKEPKSQNETSGKQQGLSNDDTHHPVQAGEEDTKSSKGEGVAETAKLKGTVSPERPQPENKDEQGKTKQDKSQ